MTAVEANPEELHGRYRVIFACFAVAGIAIWMALFFSSPALISWLVVDGAVGTSPTPALLQLKGAPGERIRLHLLDRDGDHVARSDLRVSFEERELRWVSQETVQTHEQLFSSGVFATIAVPEIQVGDSASLVGTLFGSIELGKGEPRSVEIPFHLQVARKGGVVTSGSSNAPLPGWLGMVFFFAFPFASFLGGCTASSLLHEALLHAQKSA